MNWLKVHAGGRFLMTEDGSPFFWLADTAWELFHRLSREEIVFYLQKRADQGFNVVLAVALAEIDGLRTANREGSYPLLIDGQGCYDPCKPACGEPGNYWDLIEFTLTEAARRGIYIALLPTWGDKYNQRWGKGPEVFTPVNAETYGHWIGGRFGQHWNLVWVLGGDRPLDQRRHFEVVESMARGIRKSGSRHLMTFHPMGGASSSFHFPDADWLDFHLIQSGHGIDPAPHYEMIEKDYRLAVTKPVVEGETNYEDHPIGFKAANGYFDQADVRRSSWWALLAGSMGITYGNHCVWPMRTRQDNLADPWSENYFLMDWKSALDRPGASQMTHMKALFESRGFFSRVPDQTLVVKNFEGLNHIQACRGIDYAFIYLPNGIGVTVRLGILEGKTVRIQWFDPRSGRFEKHMDISNIGEAFFLPPHQGRDHDYVMVLDGLTGKP